MEQNYFMRVAGFAESLEVGHGRDDARWSWSGHFLGAGKGMCNLHWFPMHILNLILLLGHCYFRCWYGVDRADSFRDSGRAY